MKINNPLTREFIVNYPAEAARTLEQIPAEHVAALLTELPAAMSSSVLACLMPAMATNCLSGMTPAKAAALLSEMPVATAARIFRLVSPDEQKTIASHLADKIKHRIQKFITYPVQSAGALLNTSIDIVPETITVAEAIRHFENCEHSASCEIYMVNDTHQLTGSIELGRLLASNQNDRLRGIMNRKIPSISTYADISALLSHPGWKKRRKLPVVERDNTLVGSLDYDDLQQAAGETDNSARDPLENMLSLAGLYWISVAQLLDSVMSRSKPDKGDQL